MIGSASILKNYAQLADKKGVVRFSNFVVPDITEEQFARLSAD